MLDPDRPLPGEPATVFGIAENLGPSNADAVPAAM
jgi:hypothetical protein